MNCRWLPFPGRLARQPKRSKLFRGTVRNNPLAEPYDEVLLLAIVFCLVHQDEYFIINPFLKDRHCSRSSIYAEDGSLLRRVVHLSVPHRMVKDISHTPPLLFGTLSLSRSALLIVSLLSDPELKLTFSVLPTNCLNWSVVICVPQSFISYVVGWVGVLVMLCQCSVTVIMFCNNMLQQCFVTIFL